MDRAETYRTYIQQLLAERAERSRQSPSQVEAQTVFDTERDHYQLVYVGWKRNGLRDYGCLLHLDIKDDKIWIQYDGTEGGIANKLVELGVPKHDIVLGFHPLEVRPHTEFAVS
ncbi:XisI protein [cf. Phormidesmis sp. LEGE 11477]|uniref:XisI protein n=1 Tax=cf. Phormidesmis sp. LEGE 11477 TaxID=1828680 RepID=UPI00188044CF|nr:XisI protein [cf. Phormidesmis sp. LEGE 11477]MBE9059545.1 XisI protein [cf. Phormidesmis sp. LEGE 11477]